MALNGRLSFVPTIVGAYWGSECGETDIVAYTPKEKELLLGECKYTQTEKGLAVLHKLEDKKEAFFKMTGTTEAFYIIFSTAGFTESLKKEAERRSDIILVDDSL